jgi:hypothetical protein
MLRFSNLQVSPWLYTISSHAESRQSDLNRRFLEGDTHTLTLKMGKMFPGPEPKTTDPAQL